ncbi:hypothetical protein ACPCA8_22095 [Streptomyces capoamus]|uniref:hypothetical protein n=1 Tax=Streptomyces capoamus TaxID=68183 RepID=UPI003C2F2709
MAQPARRASAPRPDRARRRRRAAPSAAALAALSLGLAGQLTAQPAAAARSHLDNPFAGAPLAGHRFPEQFALLVRAACPAVRPGGGTAHRHHVQRRPGGRSAFPGTETAAGAPARPM